MGALSDDGAVIHNEDEVSIRDGRQAMRDGEGGVPYRQCLHRIDDGLLDVDRTIWANGCLHCRRIEKRKFVRDAAVGRVQAHIVDILSRMHKAALLECVM